jgi:hypothetical protein
MKSISELFRQVILAAFTLGGALMVSCTNMEKEPVAPGVNYPLEFTLSKADLMDKIKGGWAGQVIGCTYGGPTEFNFCGTMIQDYIPIDWDSTRMEWYYTNAPGLYDDIYMDLTFVEVFEKEGLDAPAASHAHAFANADYMLWHANQAARYNILTGLEPPASGYWENNPHADDIDFQIEADFAGLMNPGMVNSASEVCDRVGHIMNYGDGWYGGVFVAAMYSLSFWSDDIPFIVSEALRTIPEQSQFYQCIHDVIGWYGDYPDDWKETWFEVERKWSSDIGCPDGVFRPFDIDAKINAAYIVIGMLYGEGDFGETLDISTRCGQDSDCNPASAGGIIGAILGYDAIPEFWRQGLDRVEDMDFKYTTISLNDTYEMGYKHALGMIGRNGGEELEDAVRIKVEEPVAVKYEKAFEGLFPVKSMNVPWENRSLLSDGTKEYSFDFSGKGFVLNGGAGKLPGVSRDVDLHIDVYVDGSLWEEAVIPTSFQARRHELTWRYNLEEGNHTVKVVWKDPAEGYKIDLDRVIVYGPEPVI